jgi:GNAT superfamily N-acetyltransferase
MKLRIIATDHPADRDRQALLDLLANFNAARIGETPFRQFALLLREPEQDDVVGGLYAHWLYDWLAVELLIVPEGYRRHGFGSELMRRAEAYASDVGCVGVWLNTFGFQARAFYEKLGYEVFGSLAEHPRGWQRYFMRKLLAPIPQTGRGDSPE